MVTSGLTVTGLSVDIADQSVIRDLTLRAAAGQILVLLGPSGCGKSTLLRTLAGLETPSAGDITWNDRSVIGTPVHQRGFGLMFQHHALFPHRSVGANVAFGLEVRGDTAAAASHRVEALLDLVGLPGFGDRRVDGLSGGEAQRVALARALAPEPRLLLLDEPLASLDRPLRDRLIGDLLRLRDELSLTAIYVTHDRDEAFALADDLAVMREGRLVAVGPPETLWAHPPTEWVARFLGHRNIVSGEWLTRHTGQDTSSPTSHLIPTPAVTVVSPEETDTQLSGIVTEARFTATGFECTVVIDGVALVATSVRRCSPAERVNLRVDTTQTVPVYPDQPM